VEPAAEGGQGAYEQCHGSGTLEEAVREQDRHQHTFLDLAKSHDWAGAREALTAEPSLVNVTPGGRWSALHQAGLSGNPGAVAMLLLFGADPTARANDGGTLKTAREVAASNEVQLLLSAAECSQAVIPEITEIKQNRELVEENAELDGRRDGSAVEPAAEGGRGAHEDCHGSGTLLNDVEDLALLKDAGLFQPMQGRIAPANITPAQPPPQHEMKEEMIPPEVANYDSYDPTMLVRPHTIPATRSWRRSPDITSAMSPWLT
jgi:hypothetical protein